MSSFVWAFLGIWFGLLTIICGKLVFQGSSADTYLGVSFSIALLLCCLVIVYFGKKLGTNDESEIIASLQRVLNAKA
jgi:uncharacterized membrane protein